MRMEFTKELRDLNIALSEMGTMVDRVMMDTHTVLRTHDAQLAREVYQGDAKVNAKESRLEQMCFSLIALQQPMASDLRTITATLKVVTDLERVGDQCADICEILLTYGQSEMMATPPVIFKMMEKARAMFGDALDSYMRKDVDLARDVAERDDEVDALFSKAILELSQLLQEHKGMVSQATDYMFMAKYIERMADHATNVAEWAIYLVTGEHKDLSHPKGPSAPESPSER